MVCVFGTEPVDLAALGLGSGEVLVASGPLTDAGQLPGEVHVAGFSGSGFSARASGCGRVSFTDRAPSALAARPQVVVVEGGLNDHDQPAAAIEHGFRALMTALVGQRVVVVGTSSGLKDPLAGLDAASPVAVPATLEATLAYVGARR